jgi:hypothetical protein
MVLQAPNTGPAGKEGANCRGDDIWNDTGVSLGPRVCPQY